MNAKLIEETVGTESERARLLQVVELLPELQAIANEYFEVESVEFLADPEEEFYYIDICVRGMGTPRELADRRLQWHRRTDDLLGENFDLVRLVISVV